MLIYSIFIKLSQSNSSTIFCLLSLRLYKAVQTILTLTKSPYSCKFIMRFQGHIYMDL
jgi:hypothetical protein